MALRRCGFLFCLASCSAAVAAPLKERGAYLREGHACEGPPKAALLDLAGGTDLVRAHGEGHAGTIAALGGSRCAWRIDCAPRQAGPVAARAWVESGQIRVLSRERVEVLRQTQARAVDAATFRFCPGLRS